MASGLLDKANIILTPTGYKAGTMYNVAPIEQPYEDFVFSRASVASRVNSSGLVEMVGRTLGSNLVQNGDFSEIGPDLVQNGTFDLGSELVTNGDFATDSDWTKGTGWSISDGSASYDGSGTGYQFILQGITTTSGSTYKINFDVLSSTGSNLNIVDFGAVRVNQTHLTAGNYTYYAQADASSENLVIYANGTDTFSIDNVSVKEVPDWSLDTGWSIGDGVAVSDGTNNADILQSGSVVGKNYKLTFTITENNAGRLSVYIGGLYVGHTGTGNSGDFTFYGVAIDTTLIRFRSALDFDGSITNVVVQELDPNDRWSIQNNTGTDTEITSGNLKIETDGAYTQVSQSSMLVGGNQYKLIYTILSSDNGDLGLVIEGNVTVSIPSSVGTHTYNFTAHSTSFVLKRRGGALNVTLDNISVKEVIDTNNIPRINYDSNGENGHWLLEPTSTNLITYSEDFTQWTLGSNSTLTYESDVVAPDGSLGVYRLTLPATSSTYIQSPLFTYNNPITLSIYAKYADASNNEFHLYDGTNTTRKITTSEWQRFDAVGFGNQLTIVNHGDTYITDIYIWGGQAEALSYATSYIPTLTGSTETRATETATGAGSADLINSTEGVLYAEIAALENDGTNRRISISDGSDTNRLNLFYTETTNEIKANYRVSNSTIVTIDTTDFNITNFNKIAFRWQSGNFVLFINGENKGTNSNTTMISANTLNVLRFEDPNLVNEFYGKCKELAVFGEALSDDELEKLTSWSSFNAMATDLGYTIE